MKVLIFLLILGLTGGYFIHNNSSLNKKVIKKVSAVVVKKETAPLILNSIRYFKTNSSSLKKKPLWRYDVTFNLSQKNVSVLFQNPQFHKHSENLTHGEIASLRLLFKNLKITDSNGNNKRESSSFIDFRYNNSEKNFTLFFDSQTETGNKTFKEKKEAVKVSQIIESLILKKISTLDQSCPPVYRPVCGVDGKTYSSACSAKKVELAYRGECQNLCTNEKNPVCGADGKTYLNPCTAHHTEIVSKGACRKAASTCSDNRPVCGIDGITYKNRCAAKNTSIQSIGPCQKQKVCPATIAPVCGIDGKTYPNKCTAGATAIQYNGPCRQQNKKPTQKEKGSIIKLLPENQ